MNELQEIINKYLSKDGTAITYSDFNQEEINKPSKHINNEMEKSAKDFYTSKKEKDDDLSL